MWGVWVCKLCCRDCDHFMVLQSCHASCAQMLSLIEIFLPRHRYLVLFFVLLRETGMTHLQPRGYPKRNLRWRLPQS